MKLYHKMNMKNTQAFASSAPLFAPFAGNLSMRFFYVKCILSTACCICLLPLLSFSQADIHFSQFYETSILRNPALTGVSNENFKFSAYYRNQWSSITNPYQTILVDAEYRFSLGGLGSDFLSVGLLGYSDEAGDLDQKISAFYPAVNYNKSVNPDRNAYLSLGFTAGYIQYSFDPSKATFNNQFQGGVYSPYNPTFENLPVPRMSTFDIGAGINYNFSPADVSKGTYMLGVSGYHFTQPQFSYYHSAAFTENIRLNINAGMVHDISNTIMMQAHFNYAQQGTYNEFIIGGLIGWRQFEAFSKPQFEIYAGAIYRLNDAIIPVLKMKYKNMGFGISYDVNTSSLTEASKTQGGLELTVSITGQIPKNREYKYTVCPRY